MIATPIAQLKRRGRSITIFEFSDAGEVSHYGWQVTGKVGKGCKDAQEATRKAFAYVDKVMAKD